MRLTLAEEQEQIKKYIQTHDVKARNAVVLSQTRFIENYAKVITDNITLQKDLVQEGLLRVFTALKSYNLETGNSFRGYCKIAVRRRMHDVLARDSQPFTISANISDYDFSNNRTNSGLSLDDLKKKQKSVEEVVDSINIMETMNEVLGTMDSKKVESFLSIHSFSGADSVETAKKYNITRHGVSFHACNVKKNLLDYFKGKKN